MHGRAVKPDAGPLDPGDRALGSTGPAKPDGSEINAGEHGKFPQLRRIASSSGPGQGEVQSLVDVLAEALTSCPGQTKSKALATRANPSVKKKTARADEMRR
jgi:hypothetical protein